MGMDKVRWEEEVAMDDLSPAPCGQGNLQRRREVAAEGAVMGLASLTTLLPQVPRKSLLPVCKLPMKRGNCRAIFTRWFYDSYAERCEQFYYGGCRGNKNNFLNKEQCEIVCRGT